MQLQIENISRCTSRPARNRMAPAWQIASSFAARLPMHDVTPSGCQCAFGKLAACNN
jgi:hypothetical protein